MLQRVRDLAVQYNNGTLVGVGQGRDRGRGRPARRRDRRIGDQTKFNGIALLTGPPTITFQVGANDGETHRASVGASHLFGTGSSFEVDSALFSFGGHGRRSRRSTTAIDERLDGPRAPSARCRTASSTR